MIEWKLIIGTLLIIEAVTLFFRFAMNKESKNYHVKRMHKKWKKRKFHWHHFIIGLAIIPVSLLFSGTPESWMFNLGIGIFLSDLVHHFVFLLLITGSPEFYLVYKNKAFNEEKIGVLTRRRKLLKKIVRVV